MTRRRIIFTTLVVLLALDAARSIYARMAYSRPTAMWVPEDFASIEWPPRARGDAAASAGARVFAERCAVCHGPLGRGNGPAAPSLSPRPRDVTSGDFKYRTTASGQPPTDADLSRTVREGLRASAMPAFGDLLSETEIGAVVAHIRSLGPDRPAPPPIPIPPRVLADAASIARGKQLYLQGCATCHGDDLRGGKPYGDDRVPARDLTAPWTFRGGSEPEELWMRSTTGLGAMPSADTWASPRDRWDIANFVLAQARRPPWEGGDPGGPGASADPLRRGSYLIAAQACALCHTQIDATGIYRHDGWFLAGGMRVGAWPHPTFVSRNLTSDEETGIGRFDEKQIARTLRDGRRYDRTLDPWGMPWWLFHFLDPADASAIATALKALPPVRNFVPEPIAYGALETFAGKVRTPLPAAIPRFLTYTDGNFGGGEAGRGAWRDVPQRALVLAQWIVLVLGIVGLLAVARASGTLLRTSLGVAIALILFGLGWIVVRLPQIVPPDPLAQAAFGAIPRPRNPTPQLERGRYLFTVAPCAFCHGSDGRGGNKISWRPFGTLWARNITPDAETGIGSWSDADIARAIRSGVSRHGRQLHWQGMPWDMFSNFDEEDVRALIAYLRALPPVHHAVPSARAPDARDCSVYTFYLRGDMSQPGCD